MKDVKAYDSQGNDLTSQIVVLGSVDVDKAGRYKFCLLYTSSNLDINLKDYKLYYNYPDQGVDGDVIWYETNEDKIIKSHDTLVFWIKNGANDDLQISDFNNKFNTNLDLSLIHIFLIFM